MLAPTTAPQSIEPELTAVPQPATKTRLLYLDNLRTFLITCVVLGHIAVTYGAFGDWYYYEAGEMSPIVFALVMILAAIGLSFALGLFFMIAGYFTPGPYDRKGAGQFMLDRLKRLGIPWLIYELLINPFIHYLVDIQGGDCLGSFYDCQFQGSLGQYFQAYPRNVGSFADGPVWFLEVLLIFSAGYALWRLATRRISGRSERIIAIPDNGTIALFALAIGLITFIVRIWALVFEYYEPFHLEFAHFPQYIALFIVGLWAYRGNWFNDFSDRQARLWRWVALACALLLPALMVAFGALSGSGTLDVRAGGGLYWQSLAFSLWEAFMCVAMCISLLTWFRGRFNHQGRLARAMSDSSFGVYILHPAIIVPFALVLSAIQLNLNLKFAIVAPIAVALCYLVVYVLRKVPLFRSVFS